MCPLIAKPIMVFFNKGGIFFLRSDTIKNSALILSLISNAKVAIQIAALLWSGQVGFWYFYVYI